MDGLRAGRPAPPEAGLLTSKPALVVANVGEGESLPDGARSRGALAVCARDEAELGELEPEEAAAMRAELGIAADALARDRARGLRAARPDHVLHRGGRQRGPRPQPARGPHGRRGGGQGPHRHGARASCAPR